MNKKIYLSSPTMHGEEQAFVKEAFDQNWVAPLGPNVNEFEKELAAYAGAGHAAALSAGTAALHLAMKLAGIKPGDRVFCSDLTFSATVNPVSYEGGQQVFIDSEYDSWNMDPRALERAFELYPNPSAVVLVHLYGTPAKLDEIKQICDAHGVPLIEDAAESLGATYRGKQTGTFGRYGIFSFNGNKIITTSGGGALVSDDASAIEKARFWATQSRDPARHYQHSELGYNYRMSNIVAGVGRGQLLHLEEHIARKQAIYQRYQEAFADIPEISMNPIPADCEPNYWLSCALLSPESRVKPLDILLALERENIEARPLWKPMHLQPVFADRAFVQVKEGVSVGEDLFNRGLCLPSDIKNTPEEMDKIISIIRNLFE